MREPASDDIDWSEARRFLEQAIRRLLHRDDPDLLQDLVQEALVDLHRFHSQGGSARNLEALMNAFAKRRLVDQLRRERVWKAVFVQAGDELPEPSAHVAPARVEGDPQAAIEFLVMEFFAASPAGSSKPSPCLELARHYFDVRNWELVAKALGRKRDAIAKQWSRCVEALRRAAREEGSALWVLGLDLGER